MRTIKFRGLRTDNKEWVYGGYINATGDSKMLIDRIDSNPENWVYQDVTFDSHLIIKFSPPDYQGWDYGNQCRFHQVLPESVSQFTGLLDKNGNETYNGDIVEAWSEGYKHIGEIRFRLEGQPSYIIYPAFANQGFWKIHGQKNKNGVYQDEGIKVIGNIHTNPELIK